MNTLALLDASTFGHATGLGANYLALYSDDPTIGIDNPSFLLPGHCNTGMFSISTLFGGGARGALAYIIDAPKIGPLAIGFQFNSYGRFDAYDEEEQLEGSFSAADYMLSLGWGMRIDDHFSIGAIFKPILSQYEQYTALAIAIDLMGSYVSTDRRFAATFMARNIGAQVITFDQSVEHLPFELSAQISYKLSRAPFRIFFEATELQRWNLRYEDPLNPTTIVDPFTGEVTSDSWLKATADNLLRHTLIGIELNLGKSLFARVGYNYRQQTEMRGADAFNLSGFAFGFGLHTKRLEFSFARRNYHLSQASNYFTVVYRF